LRACASAFSAEWPLPMSSTRENGATLFEANTLLDEDVVDAIEAAGIDENQGSHPADLRDALRSVHTLLWPAIWAVAPWSTSARQSA